MADLEQNNENENEPVEVPESSALAATGSDLAPDNGNIAEVIDQQVHEELNAPDAPQTPAKRPYSACAAENAAAKNKRKYA
jgi:hypothetical protein